MTINKNMEILDSFGIYIYNEYNSIVTLKGYEDTLFRGRSEVIIIRNDQIYLRFNKNGSYRFPGGGWDEGEDHLEAGLREAREEARINCTKVKYYGPYISLSKNVKEWVKLNVPRQYWWHGYYTELYVARFDSFYDGYIEPKDIDKKFEKNGVWVDIDDVKHVLKSVHLNAINKYLGR